MAGTVNRIEVSEYNKFSAYRKYSSVWRSGSDSRKNYFVAVQNAPSGTLVSNDSNSYWKNYKDENFNVAEIFPPSYPIALNHNTESYAASFNDGKQEIQNQKINWDSLNLEVSWENREDDFTSSLLAFVEFRGGFTSFKFKNPQFGTEKDFVCENWSWTPLSHNTNRISANLRKIYDIKSSGAGSSFFV